MLAGTAGERTLSAIMPKPAADKGNSNLRRGVGLKWHIVGLMMYSWLWVVWKMRRKDKISRESIGNIKSAKEIISFFPFP